MLCIPGFSSLSIEECHNILPCERTVTSLTGRVEDWRVRVGRIFVFPVTSPFRLRVSQYLNHATFPAPASSNPACGVTALGFPVDFTPSFMRPMGRQRFQNGPHNEPDNRHTIPGFDITSPYSTCSNQSPYIAELASNVAESSSRPSS